MVFFSNFFVYTLIFLKKIKKFYKIEILEDFKVSNYYLAVEIDFFAGYY